MYEERNLGVTEARFALTLLTCLLVAIGYVALLRLGGAKETPIEAGPEDVSPPGVAGPVNPTDELQPLELKLETPDDSPIERAARRNNRTAPLHPPTNSERR